ncbi:Protein of unknown function, DUF547 [Desulfuromusa kysingii]|uniref:DUF547 domain-containing protein n=1 Tax=Desulfuromusa kysingii TaxID=37625 RepID=A0A1H4DCU9_9BACT|nr:DUF547 domain-containing protein [Desulfuromusa kysingii]SEA70398.1 Protein of unknown function, DUF547 [Desulfuromusa kysingii]
MRATCNFFFIMSFLLLPAIVFAAPKAELWQRWQTNDPQSRTHIDHAVWANFLDQYLVVGTAESTNLVRYAEVKPDDKSALTQYIASLTALPISRLNRAEQKALWVNLYNSLTVLTILEHYPIKSIRKISSGWFSSGPWDLKLIKVEGIELSLNDIEHRILRPIWQDNRVHYAVNCASLGCPNLQAEPFTAANMERLLDKAAQDYINSLRGVNFTEETLQLSSIYDWFLVDFGGSKEALFSHLEQFATPVLASKLKTYRGTISYQYNWDLNEQRSSF